jgi:ABC-type transport system involved in multi-copper enzyme maturation permease subunit
LSSDLNDILYTPYDVGFPVYSVRALISDANVNPFLRTYERPDPLFVLTVLGSLFALLVSCDVFSGERESKRIALLLANCDSRSTLLWGKLFGSFLATVAPLMICWFVGLVSVRLVGGRYQFWPVTGVFGVVALYLAVYTVLGAGISAGSRTSVASVTKVLCVWIVTVLLVPLLGAAIAQKLYPISSAQQVEADLARERTRNQNLANFEAAKLPPNDNAAFAALYGRYEGMTSRVIHDREIAYQAQMQQQLQRAVWVERVSPASCLRLAAMRFTHTSFIDLLVYRNAILSFKLELAGYVLRKRAEQKKFGSDIPLFVQPQTAHTLNLPETSVLMLYGLIAFFMTWHRVARLTTE